MKKEDFNIYEFHQQLSALCGDVPIKEMVSKYDEIKDVTIDNFEEELRCKQEIRDLQVKITFNTTFVTFDNDTKSIINQFKELLNCTIKDSFTKKKKATSDVNIQKKQLTTDYLNEVNKYSIFLIHLPSFEEEYNKQLICADCKVDLDCFEHNLICPSCFVEKPYFYQDENISFKDLSRINTNIKYSYIRQTHFRDTMKQFQGKQNKFIDEKVYKTLINCFESSGMQANAYCKYNVTKDHIKMFLQQNSLYKYYEDINLIYFELTGISCPDITIYEKKLIEDFDKFVIVYDKVIQNDYSNYTRSNILNSYYILYQLLKKNGYQCKESDFPIIKTVDRKIEHDEIYEKCCKQLGWFFYPTV